jgi:hypothetical protein
MKRYEIREVLSLGIVEVPDDMGEEEVWDWMDKNDCWPDDETVIDHTIHAVEEEDETEYPVLLFCQRKAKEGTVLAYNKENLDIFIANGYEISTLNQNRILVEAKRIEDAKKARMSDNFMKDHFVFGVIGDKKRVLKGEHSAAYTTGDGGMNSIQFPKGTLVMKNGDKFFISPNDKAFDASPPRARQFAADVGFRVTSESTELV